MSAYDFFPFTKEKYEKQIQEKFEGVDIIVIEDIFMPEVIKLLEKNTNKVFLRKIFEYFEKVVNEGDEYLFNAMFITVLEILGNDSDVLDKAKQYMGAQTMKFQFEADREMGRI